MADIDPKLEAELRSLLAQGQMIGAVRRYREATGADLAAAKQAVEALAEGRGEAQPEAADSSLENEIASLLEGGKKIKAVKLYRERRGVDLKAAKEAVEAIAQKRNIAMPSGTGCLGAVLLSATVVGLSLATAAMLVADDAPTKASKLAFDTFSGYFVSNKFEPDAAASFAVIEGKQQFDKVFGVAFVMGDKSHRLPKDAWNTSLVLTAIKRGKAVWEFKVEQATLDKGVVELRYTTTEKKSDSATFACPLIVSIPQGKYTAVQFVENGKPVKKLAIGAGAP